MDELFYSSFTMGLEEENYKKMGVSFRADVNRGHVSVHSRISERRRDL